MEQNPYQSPTTSSDVHVEDYLPTASWEMLRRRAELLKSVRQFFEARDFLEVETPIISADTVVDRHLEPIPVENLLSGKSNSSDEKASSQSPPMWLQTSPEFAMKRLMAAGGKAIFQIARVFRKGECGAQHNPEFTMLEWYRAGDDLNAGMDLLCEFAAEFLNAGPPVRMNYRQAFLVNAKVDPFAANIADLASVARQRAVNPPWQQDHLDLDDWLNFLFSECVQPHLGKDCPAMVYDWPATQAALARIRNDSPPVAERFELFYRGIELANGYHELTDADGLAKRNAAVNQLRAKDGNPTLPEHSRLLSAMRAGFPACTGVALGIDRLLMVITGAKHIADVIAFPIDRA